jgi:hypothetical protein
MAQGFEGLLVADLLHGEQVRGGGADRVRAPPICGAALVGLHRRPNSEITDRAHEHADTATPGNDRRPVAAMTYPGRRAAQAQPADRSSL